MAKWRVLAIALGGFLFLALLPPSICAADEPPLSAAQIALFKSDHLAAIEHPATLDYIFRHDGSEPYRDTVALVLREVHPDGSRDVSVEFLSGDRRMEFSPVTRFHGNPLIMYFLEWDVRRMHEATGGSALYFRNRIREAFVDQAELADASITLDGRPEPAMAITVQPYRRDPGIQRYPAFRDKSYRFVLADARQGLRDRSVSARRRHQCSRRHRSGDLQGNSGMTVRVLGPACAVILFLSSVSAYSAENDYPTSARADYVIGCIAANGNNREALQKCSCAIDTIAGIMPYSHYEQAETALSLQAGGGVGGRVGLFRDPLQIKTVIEELRRAQAEANLQCQ